MFINIIKLKTRSVKSTGIYGNLQTPNKIIKKFT